MTRQLILRLHTSLLIDSFAGGGGASTGITWALGRSPDIAVNHDAKALAMHAANHPQTLHLQESVYDVDPVKVTGGKPVALAWFSPDCVFHSRARGGKPFRDRDAAKRRRGLAWVVTVWAKKVRPRVILAENVMEMADWGPLLDDGTPCPERKGKTFQAWVARLRNLGYVVEWRELRACDYGAPTTRKRLFIAARCDGNPIVWPKETHGPGRPKPHRTAAECIDWSLPCPSIFMTAEEAKARGLDVRRPLAEKTMARIARGVFRFVIEAGRPFIIPVTHGGGRDRVHSIDDPIRTVTAANRGEMALVAPTLIQTGYGERQGQAPRILDLHKPLGTVVAGGVKHGLVAAYLAKHYGGKNGATGSDVSGPIHTITSVDHHSLVTAHLHPAPAEPFRSAEVRAFILRYYGQGTGQRADEPMHTIPTHDRFALVTVAGVDYSIVDIGLRMLTPRELFTAQGFPPEYRIDVPGLTKTDQIEKCGNAVPPHLSEALARANCADLAVPLKRRRAA